MRRAAWALAVWPWGMPAARPAPEADSLAVAKLRDFNAQRGCAGAVCTVKLFFVHLHKCGGTTVESYFRQAYGDAFLVPDTGHEGELRDALVVQNKARIRALRAFARPYRVFARHIAYGYHATVDCARPLYMTMLREPTARLLSLYGYLMFGEGKKYRRFPANATFGEFVRHRTTGTCAESTGGRLPGILPLQLPDAQNLRLLRDPRDRRALRGDLPLRRAPPRPLLLRRHRRAHAGEPLRTRPPPPVALLLRREEEIEPVRPRRDDRRGPGTPRPLGPETLASGRPPPRRDAPGAPGRHLRAPRSVPAAPPKGPLADTCAGFRHLRNIDYNSK